MKPRTSTRHLGLCVLTAMLVLVPAVSRADGTGSASGSGTKSSASKKSSDTPDDASADKGGSFKQACTDGATKYAARDFPGAIAAFQKAIESQPKNALGHYFLGEAQLAANNLTEADAAWTRAALVANEKDPALRARVLFVVADLKERQKKWDDARAAWQVYLDWAAKYPEAKAFTGSGQSRQQVIDAMTKQDKQMAVVRQRTTDTAKGGVFSDPNKPTPPSSASSAPSP